MNIVGAVQLQLHRPNFAGDDVSFVTYSLRSGYDMPEGLAMHQLSSWNKGRLAMHLVRGSFTPGEKPPGGQLGFILA